MLLGCSHISCFVPSSAQNPKTFHLRLNTNEKSSKSSQLRRWNLDNYAWKCLIFLIRHTQLTFLVTWTRPTNTRPKVIWETFTCFSSAVNLGFCSPVENRACPTAFSMTGVKVANRCLYKVKYRQSTSHVKLGDITYSCCFTTCHIESHEASFDLIL